MYSLINIKFYAMFLYPQSREFSSMNKKNMSPEPGKRIRDLRERLGLTRSQFEKITGMSGSTLRYLEIGERELTPLKAKLLANLFIYLFKLKEHEASANFLLYGTDNKVKKK